jgi:DNA invertase Pin-like site-specific DNA recombinase
MATVGYARTSTMDQLLDLQVDALNAAGCSMVFTDQISGATTDRPGLLTAMAAIQAGDTFVVWKLDRLGRSVGHLSDTVHSLINRGITFRSLTEAIDTGTAAGRLLLHMLASVAEFERDLARERITAGMSAARSRGRHVGRPRALTAAQIELARDMQARGHSLRQIADLLGGNGVAKASGGRRRLSPSTVQAALQP